MPPSLPGQGATAREVDSTQYWQDSTKIKNMLQEAKTEASLPRTPEEIDIIADRLVAKQNLHAQPSHGTLSIMENQLSPVAQPPMFTPPDLPEKLSIKETCQTLKRMTDSACSMDNVKQPELSEDKDSTPKSQYDCIDNSEDRTVKSDPCDFNLLSGSLGSNVNELESTVAELESTVAELEATVAELGSTFPEEDFAVLQEKIVPELGQKDPDPCLSTPQLQQSDSDHEHSTPEHEHRDMELNLNILKNEPSTSTLEPSVSSLDKEKLEKVL